MKVGQKVFVTKNIWGSDLVPGERVQILKSQDGLYQVQGSHGRKMFVGSEYLSTTFPDLRGAQMTKAKRFSATKHLAGLKLRGMTDEERLVKDITDKYIAGYLRGALYYTLDDEPLFQNYTIMDFSAGSQDDAREDILQFVTTNAADLKASGLSGDDIGRLFWFTRQHEGINFCDDVKDSAIAKSLNAAARKFPEVSIEERNGRLFM